MLISKNWITRLLANAGNEGFNPTDEELDAGFVRVGFETEGYAPLPETTGPLVIGRVKEIEELTGFKKPIRYCQVDVGRANGTGEPQGIICGARNFAEGDLVIVSLPGAVLPGGFEIAALTGAYLAAAQQGVAVLVDGFICSVAALLAVRLNPGCRDWLLFAHHGAEPGHVRVLQALEAEPLLELGLRLGEGSGAALAVPLLRLACALHGQMATFAEAAVAERPS